MANTETQQQQKFVFWPEYDKMDRLMKDGYKWFDMMYPRGSDAEARELKIGKYADPVVDAKIQAEKEGWTEVISGKKRRRVSSK